MSTQNEPDRYLPAAGARLRWRLEGQGPAIVLLHGWALDLNYWDALVPLLAPRFQLLRFDRRGFGLSQGLPDIHRNVEDLAAVLDAAGIDRAVLLGMSQGARLALHFAQRHVQRVRGLVLDGAPAVEAETELPLAECRRQLQAGGNSALQATILQLPPMQLRNADATVRSHLQAMVARYQGLDLLNPAAPAAPPDPTAIQAPLLIVNGSLDSAARREAGRQLQRASTTARRVELAGAGHLALLDDPAAYASAVASFIHALPA
jgi:3-oxoadipate enol-lactonase